MPLTTQQTQTILNTLPQMQSVISQIQSCAADTQGLLGTSWVVTTSLGQTSVQYTLTAAQQNAIIAQYTSLKASLVALYSQMP